MNKLTTAELEKELKKIDERFEILISEKHGVIDIIFIEKHVFYIPVMSIGGTEEYVSFRHLLCSRVYRKIKPLIDRWDGVVSDE